MKRTMKRLLKLFDEITSHYQPGRVVEMLDELMTGLRDRRQRMTGCADTAQTFVCNPQTPFPPPEGYGEFIVHHPLSNTLKWDGEWVKLRCTVCGFVWYDHRPYHQPTEPPTPVVHLN